MTALSSLIVWYLLKNLFSFIKYLLFVIENLYSQVASKTLNVWQILHRVILNFDMICRTWIIFWDPYRCFAFIVTILLTLNRSCRILKLFSWFWKANLYFSFNRSWPNQFFLWDLSLKWCRGRTLKFTD